MRQRIKDHQTGRDATTRRFLPVKLIYYEAFPSEEDARRREKYFKTNKGKITLRLMLRETLKQITE